MRLIKRFISVVLTVLFLVGCVPATASARTSARFIRNLSGENRMHADTAFEMADPIWLSAGEHSADGPSLLRSETGTAVNIGTAAGNPGDTVTVPVSIAENPGFAGFTFEVSYADTLTLTKVTKGSLLQGSDGGSMTSNAVIVPPNEKPSTPIFSPST